MDGKAKAEAYQLLSDAARNRADHDARFTLAEVYKILGIDPKQIVERREALLRQILADDIDLLRRLATGEEDPELAAAVERGEVSGWPKPGADGRVNWHDATERIDRMLADAGMVEQVDEINDNADQGP